MKMSESITELSIALAKFRGEVKQPKKDSTNPHFRSTYVNLEGVVKAFDDIAPKFGLSFVQVPVTEINNEFLQYTELDKYNKEKKINTFADRVGVYTILIHESGQFIQTDPIFALPVKNDPQGVGSTITYLKRYSLSAVLGITSDEDDDGNNGTGLDEKPKNTEKPKQAYSNNQTTTTTTTTDKLSDAQLSAFQTKLAIIAKKEDKKVPELQTEVYEFCSITPGKSSRDLTKAEASKLIGYLVTLEKA